MNWENLRKPIRATFKNLCPKPCPNFSFTVESKKGNLHKIRQVTFQT